MRGNRFIPPHRGMLIARPVERCSDIRTQNIATWTVGNIFKHLAVLTVKRNQSRNAEGSSAEKVNLHMTGQVKRERGSIQVGSIPT